MTTGVSSKVGGKGEVETNLQMRSFEESMTSQALISAMSIPTMSPAKTTQLMTHHEEFTHPLAISSLQLKYPPNSSCSLLTLMCHLTSLSWLLPDMETSQLPSQNHQKTQPMKNVTQSTTNSNSGERHSPVQPRYGNHSRTWNAPLCSTPLNAAPAPYRPHLTPVPSPLHPHCLAHERLHLWKPATSRSSQDDGG